MGFYNAVGCERKERDKRFGGGGSFPLSHLLERQRNGSGTAGTVRGTAVVPNGEKKSCRTRPPLPLRRRAICDRLLSLRFNAALRSSLQSLLSTTLGSWCLISQADWWYLNGIFESFSVSSTQTSKQDIRVQVA